MPPRGCLRCDDATLEALVRWMAFEALETGANALTEVRPMGSGHLA